MVKVLKLMALALIGTVLFPFALASDGEGKMERIALFFAGLLTTILLFPALFVIIFVELKEKNKKKQVPLESLLSPSPLGITLLAFLLRRKS